jgi:hypothetical protein
MILHALEENHAAAWGANLRYQDFEATTEAKRCDLVLDQALRRLLKRPLHLPQAHGA